MEQVFEFIGNHPFLTGGFFVVLAILLYTEFTRLTRKFREVETREAIRLINREDAVLLDVSGSADYGKGHILGARHMPPTRIEAGNAELAKLKERPIVVYCKNGQVSPQMASRLTGLGFTQVSVLKGGLAQWRADGQPVAKGKTGRA